MLTETSERCHQTGLDKQHAGDVERQRDGQRDDPANPGEKAAAARFDALPVDKITGGECYVTFCVIKIALRQRLCRLDTGDTADSLVVEPARDSVEVARSAFVRFFRVATAVNGAVAVLFRLFVFSVVVGIKGFHCYSW
ncbi:hypothetical protein [Klebsiella aerogenes]|uniref:hypothetical protein n=1 Tax=Klebsiella aerogenes TaxID=548 RepID=UPI0034D3811D